MRGFRRTVESSSAESGCRQAVAIVVGEKAPGAGNGQAMTIKGIDSLAVTRRKYGDPNRAGALIRLTFGMSCAWFFFLAAPSPAQETPSQTQKGIDAYPQEPDPKRVFRLESEAELTQRMIRNSKTGENLLGIKYLFLNPDYPAVSKEKFVTRQWDPLTEMIEPPYVCYRRLYFEQINSERYGWDLGLGHPLLSAGIFFSDVALLPYHAFTEPLRRYECNAGYYLPGDPVPLLLYPPELSLTGALAEAAVIGIGFAIFP
jgi:hypothetical protein